METTYYLKQATDFLSQTNTIFKAEFLKNDFHFAGDKEKRDIYKISLSRGSRSYSFEFGQSIIDSTYKVVTKIAPNCYDVLACLTKTDPGTFENFCSDFGYDYDSRTAEKIYKSVCDEYKTLCTLFSDSELELMAEIQ